MRRYVPFWQIVENRNRKIGGVLCLSIVRQPWRNYSLQTIASVSYFSEPTLSPKVFVLENLFGIIKS